MKLWENSEPVDQHKISDDEEDTMQELDFNTVAQLTGAGNPFSHDRMEYQDIDDDLRRNG